MNKIKTLKTITFSLILLIITSCSKDDNNSSTNEKTIKYEITGNYSGQLLVIYNDNVSGNTTVTVSSLPWSKTINYPSNVLGIGIGGNGIVGKLGTAGQTVSVKIYNGTTVLKSGSATADANGAITLSTLAHVFQ
ncbi:MAG: hypothetical protein PHC28_08280 [Flavobacterium sp.]|uniref:hypothetical protein n=1 Tax=Flavobacterium sp. TaxID=239 RepID=UPI002638D2E5|nr:hypothetical protein [Flavobacterium sp.]MDD5150468.1 hypothetical protein [Flavobacterium sp.]